MTTGQETSGVYEQLDELLADGPRELIRLTDEELVAADQLTDDARVAVTPYLDGIADDETRQLVVACGMRALVSRGAVAVDDLEKLRQNVETAAGKGENDVSFDLRYAPDLDLALNLRLTADKVLVVEQVAAGDVRDWHYLYPHGDRFCLQEAVTAAGQRVYTLLDLPTARQRLAGLVDPLGVASSDSEPRTVDANAVADGDPGPLGTALESSRLVTQIMELYPTADTAQGRLTVCYLTDDELWTVESQPMSDSETLTVRTVSPDGLASFLEQATRRA